MRYFICGIGGSGMLPLAVILKGMGHEVWGSDRSRDQGRTPEKFAWIESQGMRLFPQDGSGLDHAIDAVLISKAVEDTIPDIIAARQKNIPIRLRVEGLIDVFNAAPIKIAIAGTSGKTTTTGMIGFILHLCGLAPTVMNGGIFKNFEDKNPYATALVGNSQFFVTEVDESDGDQWVSRYKPDIAVIHNIALDHEGLPALRTLFQNFISNTQCAVVNIDHEEVRALLPAHAGRVATYGYHETAMFRALGTDEYPDSTLSLFEKDGVIWTLRLPLPGRYNVSNALAAIAACDAAGIPPDMSIPALSHFQGIRRRMELVGQKGGITVIDDFAHNPDKIVATLSTLKAFEGRLIIFFQPHGYKFLKLVYRELFDVFESLLSREDMLFMVEPLYMGGTVDREIGSAMIADMLTKAGKHCAVLNDRSAVKQAILSQAKAGDRIIIMGARDDTLSVFARDIYNAL